MALCLQAFADLIEDLGSDASSHTGHLMVTYNFSSRGSYVLFWFLQTLHAHGALEYIQAHIHTHKINK